MNVLELPLLTDENIAPAVVAELRGRGYDVRTVIDEGLGTADDAAILARARDLRRVVLTHDSDLGDLVVRAGKDFFGIVYLRPGHISVAFVLEILDAIETVDAEVKPPFIVVATRTGAAVRVRLRTFSAP